MRYLIDTNIWIYYLKRPFSTVRTRLAEHPINDIAVCSVVWAELLHRARKDEDCVTRESILQTTLSPFNLETGMERDEDGVVLGSTRLPGSQRLHR